MEFGDIAGLGRVAAAFLDVGDQEAGVVGDVIVFVYFNRRSGSGRQKLQQVDEEDEVGVRGNAPRPGLAKSQVGGNDELRLPANAHCADGLAQAREKLLGTQGKDEWLAGVNRTVQQRAIGEPGGEVAAHRLHFFLRVAVASLFVVYL